MLLVSYIVLASAALQVLSLPQSHSSYHSGLIEGQTYTNKGLVGFGSIPSNVRESEGDTIGGIGGAVAVKPGSYALNKDGTYTGIFITHPDRGYVVDDKSIDYQGRRLEFTFTLSPYYQTTKKLSLADARKTLRVSYTKTVLEVDKNGVRTSGLDALSVRGAQTGYPSAFSADPQLPIPSSSYDHLSLDVEAIALNSDGSYWVSDEYGPYIYRFSSNGTLVQTIQPPSAILPKSSQGILSFSYIADPATGRRTKQGFEGLSIDLSTNTLYAMLQSATMQDGGADKKTSRYTRLLAYNVANYDKVRPTLIGEWVVPLPLGSNGKTRAQSEIQLVGPGKILVLARDGIDGQERSTFGQVDLVDFSQATDIHGTKYDVPANPISPKGKLVAGITPAVYTSFLNLLDEAQLSKFGLYAPPDSLTPLNEKWEGMSLASCLDPRLPNDFFLFVSADNDFISTQGISLGKPYNAGYDLETQFLVYRLTLPGKTT